MGAKGIIVFGNPIIDSFAFVSDEFLVENNLGKGQNIILGNDKVIALTKKLNLEFRECGGSGMNVARWIGILGYRAAVIGQYADDERGALIEKGLNECCVENKCIVKKGGITTNICVCVTPDKQRTMIGIFGASHEKYVQTIDVNIVADYEMVLIEGYAFATPILIEMTTPSIEKACELNKKLVMVISSIFQVPGYKENLLKWIYKFSIVTGTEEEFRLLFDKNNLEEVLSFLEQSSFELCAVTMGADGCYLIHKSQRIFVPAPDVDKIMDTTGAGDSFTGGLLFGYLKGYDIKKSAHIAKILAGHAISQIGIKINKDVKRQVEQLINKGE